MNKILLKARESKAEIDLQDRRGKVAGFAIFRSLDDQKEFEDLMDRINAYLIKTGLFNQSPITMVYLLDSTVVKTDLWLEEMHSEIISRKGFFKGIDKKVEMAMDELYNIG